MDISLHPSFANPTKGVLLHLTPLSFPFPVLEPHRPPEQGGVWRSASSKPSTLSTWVLLFLTAQASAQRLPPPILSSPKYLITGSQLKCQGAPWCHGTLYSQGKHWFSTLIRYRDKNSNKQNHDDCPQGAHSLAEEIDVSRNNCVLRAVSTERDWEVGKKGLSMVGV
jgi:hypothetical protein